ncbi:MAG: SGNH/GDSL hydrolase family protein [Variovorax sp.]|nr:MAG: SGNH/GDSL hydrolase family protein [Variovorax sp.]
MTRHITLGHVIPETAIPLAVLGDSNSHSYQDRISFPLGSGLRGGDFQSRTFQWTEVLARLRGDFFDPGPWVTWGHRPRVATWRERLGLGATRAPEKQDYLFNFANSGADCRGLMEGGTQQAPRLVALMNEQPARWQQGVVVIRIGMAVLSQTAFLDRLAQDPQAADAQQVIGQCVDRIGQAVTLIRHHHPSTHIVLVGIFNDAHDPLSADQWRDRQALDHIDRGLDVFDNALKRLASATARISFFDERAHFARYWGSRDADGRPAYRTVKVGSRLEVRNALGDSPDHAFIADDHWGLVGNVLWAQALTVHLREVAGVQVKPITDPEVKGFIEALL